MLHLQERLGHEHDSFLFDTTEPVPGDDGSLRVLQPDSSLGTEHVVDEDNVGTACIQNPFTIHDFVKHIPPDGNLRVWIGEDDCLAGASAQDRVGKINGALLDVQHGILLAGVGETAR